MGRSIGVKEKDIVESSVWYASRFFFVGAVLLMVSMYALSASVAVSGVVDFEIPLSELNKEKKAPSPKRAVSKPKKKKKKTSSAPEESVTESATSALSADPAKSPATELKGVVALETAPTKVPVSPKLKPETIRIDHVPFSFVVPGKSTVVHAVIYRDEADLQAVNCKVRVAETGAVSLVKMTKVNGTRFTYEATLPSPAPGSSSLRYTIIVIDSLGKESSSSEFVTPVSPSPVVPGWQL